MMLALPSLTASFPGKVTCVALSLCLMSFLHFQKELPLPGSPVASGESPRACTTRLPLTAPRGFFVPSLGALLPGFRDNASWLALPSQPVPVQSPPLVPNLPMVGPAQGQTLSIFSFYPSSPIIPPHPSLQHTRHLATSLTPGRTVSPQAFNLPHLPTCASAAHHPSTYPWTPTTPKCFPA